MDGAVVQSSRASQAPMEAAGPASTRSAPAWQQATVADIFDEAPDAVTLRLRLTETNGFKAGQYYNVRLPVPGRARPIQRAYSVGSSPAPDPSTIDLGIRELPGGLVSPRLVHDLKAGTRIEVRGPYGRFVWSGDPGPVLLVGAGSGLVPLMSMIRYAAVSGRAEPVWLVCSVATYDHAFYRDELGRLAASTSWFRVVHCVTRSPSDPRADYHRRIDGRVLDEVLAGTLPVRAYVCGPPAMVAGVADALARLGVDPADVHAEKYD